MHQSVVDVCPILEIEVYAVIIMTTAMAGCSATKYVDSSTARELQIDLALLQDSLSGRSVITLEMLDFKLSCSKLSKAN